MPIEFTLDDGFVEKSTGIINIAFRDENGQAKEPDSATWTLTDEAGAIINSRHEVVITPIASVVDVVLSDGDLQLSTGFSGEAEWRVLLVEAIYDSSLGQDLPLKDFCKFPVINVAHITNP